MQVCRTHALTHTNHTHHGHSHHTWKLIPLTVICSLTTHHNTLTYAYSHSNRHTLMHFIHTHNTQALLDRLVASEVLSAYERDYELDRLCWFYDEMGGGVEAKRKKTIGGSSVAGVHYRPCTVTTGLWLTLNDPWPPDPCIFVAYRRLERCFPHKRWHLYQQSSNGQSFCCSKRQHGKPK